MSKLSSIFQSLVILCSLSLVSTSSLAEEDSTSQATEVANSTQPASSKPTTQKIESTVLGMNISGNKELPNVLYIVPWKGDSTIAPLPEVTRLVDEVYAPVDPDVFGKQVMFYYQLTDKSAAKTEQQR